MELRRLLCVDGTVHLYAPPLEIAGQLVGLTDESGLMRWVDRAEIAEISVESGSGAHPDDDEMARIESD